MRNRESSANSEILKQRARDLRRERTPAEHILWQKLRGKQLLGLRFRRQEPVGPFIADFLCVLPRLVIELDGESHDYTNLDGVLETILERCQTLLALAPKGAPTQPPPEEEE
ncbi:MAG: DUF559 domain-containing protein [Armatimonadota bacterium]|nr:DUF559 domain-containing protein [Armatimonadota bacterium]